MSKETKGDEILEAIHNFAKENYKLANLIEILRERKIINDFEVKKILAS
jgi:hypothetical protein